MEPILTTWFFFFLSTCRGCKVLFTVSNISPSLNCMAHHVNYSVRVSVLKIETKYWLQIFWCNIKREICTCFLYYKKRCTRNSYSAFHKLDMEYYFTGVSSIISPCSILVTYTRNISKNYLHVNACFFLYELNCQIVLAQEYTFL